MTTKEIIAAFERGARANRQDSFRDGNIIRLAGPGDVIMTGDLHGNELNFDRLCREANLGNHRNRHLILHELLHRSNNQSLDRCDSYLLLARAVQLKVEYPDQVHFLLSNHETAQVTGDEILKNGQPMVRAVNTAISEEFAEKSTLVQQAMCDFILSLPLAVRTANRVWMSHSLPSKRHLADFEDSIFERELSKEDLKSDKSVRSLTWDRGHTAEGLDILQEKWDVDHFIVGHQPQANGYSYHFERMIILASDHPHGCYLPFALNKNYEKESLFDLIKPLAAIQ
jgi:calcineurin-like phosphoesterase family protein